MAIRFGLTYLVVLLCPVVAIACQQPAAQEPAVAVGQANAEGKNSSTELAQLILDADRIVVGQVTDLIQVPQVWPIAPTRDWDAVVGTYMHGVGQDVEIALFKVDEAVVAPSEVESIALLGRLNPADRHSTLELGQRGLLFLEQEKSRTGFSSGTHEAIRNALDGKEIWRFMPPSAWNVDSKGQLAMTDALRSALDVEADALSLAEAVRSISECAKTLLPRCDLHWSDGSPRGDGWSAVLESSGERHEFQVAPWNQTASSEVPLGQGAVPWNADESGRAFRNLVAAAGGNRSHQLGGRAMHSALMVFNIRTMRGSLFIRLAWPFDNTEGRSQKDQLLAVACIAFLRELRFQELPQQVAQALRD